jgi:lipopolysaccharide transport system ATP-binding protein
VTGPIITVDHLSKVYTLGHLAQKGDGLRHAFENAIRAPFAWIRGQGRGNGKTREDFWALRDVNTEIAKGDVVGIIGRNGAGKSTLLKILSRITDPTSGRVRLRGRVASLLEVGTGFHPELTGRENVFLNGAILGMSRTEIKRKFDEIVAFAEIDRFLDTPVKRYSSGMYVRLAFAVAAHLDPEILIVDEVLAVGDANFQKKCLGKMRDVAAGEGRTVLFVSHNMTAISSLCRRGLLMTKGGLECDGTIEAAVNQYVRGNRDETGAWTAPGVTVALSFLDTQGKPLTTWGSEEELILRAQVQSDHPIDNPAVDFAFYTEAGSKVFAIKSDRLRGEDAPRFKSSNFVFEVGIQNLGLIVPSLTVDIGLRASAHPEYIAWWQRVETLAISARNLDSCHTYDAILAPPVRLITAESTR